ncbi:MAG TPA: adenylate/guanylate cyclase domain-containing protein [Candidatus Limnocylindrales bacterium]
MICPSCGSENRVGAKFCSECATPLAAVCPTCGTSNAPAAKFCSECATPLVAGARPAAAASPFGIAAAPSPAGAATTNGGGTGAGDGPVAERRLVSILFADLVGFTTLSEGRDHEEVRELLSRYFDTARELIGRYGGTVEKFIGDAVMAVWGAPVAQEDDPERAVRAALDLVAAVRDLGPGVQARAGVLTGEAAVTLGATNQGMVAGDIVNTASRLQSAAQPGTVLVGEATQRAAAGSIVFEEAGEQSLKGKAAPVPAWRALRVVAERGGRNRSDTLEAPFVGREEELRQLKDLFHASARERKPRLVSVIGPAGIGKSRLAWEFLKYLDGLADLVYWHAGRSPAYGDGISFWALGEMVRARAGLVEADDEATSRAKIHAMILERVPDPDEQVWVEPALLTLIGLRADVASDQLFAAWRTFFERLAASAPVILVFEDLHHADSGTLDFIDHLLEWSRGVPITILTLARPDLLERRPDWGAGKRTFAGIHLEPLTPEAMRELLAGLVPGLPAKAAEAIVARADGIPLYAVETVRMLLAQGKLVAEGGAYRPAGAVDELAVPETLTALIAARLDGLDPTDRGLVEDAAVLGQSFTLAGLASLSGVATPELEQRLRGLVRRELLVLDLDPRSPERGQYRFVQALIREVAYNTLSKKDRKVRHLAAARWFESLGAEELAGGLAGHYVAAQRLASDPAEADALAAQARIALRGAAERSAALGAHEQAFAFLVQALAVTSEPAERADLHERARIEALQGLDPLAVVEHAEAAVAERRKTGDRPAIATAIAEHAAAISSLLGDPVRALAVLDEAWAEFSDLEEAPAGVALMIGYARANRSRNDSHESLRWTERFLPIAERLGLTVDVTRGLMGRGAVCVIVGRPIEGMVLLRGAHQLALAHDFGEVELNARVLMTFMEQWADPGAGVALTREGFEIARRTGSRGYGFQMVGNGTICAIPVGEWDWATALLDEWIALEATAGQRAEFYYDRSIFKSLRGDDGTADAAEGERLRTEAGISDPQWQSYEHWSQAWIAFARGDLATASAEAVRAMEVTDYFMALAWPLAVRAALWSGDADAARAIIELPGIQGFAGALTDADQVLARAGLAAVDGRSAEAIAGFREALRGYRAIGASFAEAVAAVDLATLLPAAERRAADLDEAIRTAEATLSRLGARPFLERLEASRDREAVVDAPAGTRDAVVSRARG